MAQSTLMTSARADLDAVTASAAAPESGNGVRITHFDQWQMPGPNGSSFTWICLIDVYADPTAA